MTVEHDDRHPRTCHQRPRHLLSGERFTLPIEQGDEQHGEERTRTDYQRGVRCRGIDEGCVLGEEIECPTR